MYLIYSQAGEGLNARGSDEQTDRPARLGERVVVLLLYEPWKNETLLDTGVVPPNQQN